MNEKQKAKELIEEFIDLLPYSNKVYETAKQCALICVEKIIKDLEQSFDVARGLHPHAKGLIAGSLFFWKSVKEEIKNYQL